MCGIAGATKNLLGSKPEKILRRMSDVIKHRGPDNEGIFFNDQVGLAHRRLSILDLSSNGRQPMLSSDGQIALVYNGEIYNYPELKRLLESKGYQFRTGTDTEALLYLYQEEGIECLEHLRGMFAFAFWDKRYNRLFLARDRIGKKPLFYYSKENKFAFGSEIKSILELSAVSRIIEPTALVDFLKNQYIPNPKTIYQNIYKLPPGHYLIFENDKPSVNQYWDLDLMPLLDEDEDSLAASLLSKVHDSVSCRLLSDVPLGAFLSSGIDSSAVVAVMSQIQSNPVNTCTVGFDEAEWNEAKMAAETAEYFRTNHREFKVDSSLSDILEQIIWHFDEPFADDSAIPTYYVSKLARQIVTVALSGDGGDENFAGYEKYYKDNIENQIRRFFPQNVAKYLFGMQSCLSFLSNTTIRKMGSLLENLSVSPERAYYNTNAFSTDHTLFSILSPSFYSQVDGYDPFENIKKYFESVDAPDHLSRLLYVDFKTYLTDDILVKVDRMSMANSLEVRCPLLDQELVSFSAKIPSRLKMNGNNQKAILKKSMSSTLPPFVFKRQKRGFDLPKSKWLRGDLKTQSEFRIFKQEYMKNFFNLAVIKNYWDNYQRGDERYANLLWSMLNFSVWFKQYML